MKRSSGVRWFCLLLSLFYQSVLAQIEWSDPIELGYGSSPDFVIDRQTGRLHVVIKNDYYTPPLGAGGVCYIVLDSLGGILHQETPVPGTESDYNLWDSGPCITVDKISAPHICYRQGNQGLWNWPYTIYYKRKTSASFTAGWSNNVPISHAVPRGYNVRMTIDSENIVHIVRGTQIDQVWGPIKYHQLWNGTKIFEQTIEPAYYRNDNSFRIATDKNGIIHFVFGCPGLQSNTSTGTIKYFRRLPGDGNMFYITDLQKSSGMGRTCSPDVFPDQVGFVHFSYGTNSDAEAGGPAIRYARYGGNTIRNDTLVTLPGEMDPYTGGANWAISSVASTDNGEGVIVTFLTSPNGDGRLLAKMSIDSGRTWFPPVELSSSCGGEDGRNRPLIRAFKNHFYLVYPQNGDYPHVKLRILMSGGDGPPVALMSGPAAGDEGQTLTFDASESYDTGQTPKLAYYDWDWNQDGLIDLTSEAPVVEHIYDDNFTGEITLIVRDQWDQADTTFIPITISNLPPTIEIGSNRLCDEGETLQFESETSDPGTSDQLTVTWQINGGNETQGQSMSHLFRNDGTYTVTAIVADDDGSTDQDELTVHVNNLSPTVSMQIPHAGSTQMELTFQAQASDPGSDDVLTYKWDLENDNIYERTGQTISATFNTEGLYPISLRVSDGDGGFGYADEDLLIINAPPEITPIPEQTIPEGGTFESVSLDDYVTDPVIDVDQLIWTFDGSYDLQLQLNNRILQTAVPDSEWSGHNNVILICTNHINLKDTGVVVFNVDPVNDRPHWIAPLSHYQFLEDDSLCIPLDSLRIRTADIDNLISQMSYSIEPHQSIHSMIDPVADQIILWGDPDWADETEVVFVVQDPDGRQDRTTANVLVEGQPDDPLPFSLLDPFYYEVDVWPDTVHFLWEASEDPDLSGSLIYEWTLEHQGGHPTSPLRQMNMTDTSYALVPDGGLIDGTYFWWVRAVAPTGNARRSDNVGFLVIGNPSSVESEEAFLPDEFALYQNYPNPFNPETRITYHLAEKVHVSLVVYNPRGQAVRRLVETTQGQGAYTVTWDSRDGSGNVLPSGVYIYRLQAGSHGFNRKMLLIQ